MAATAEASVSGIEGTISDRCNEAMLGLGIGRVLRLLDVKRQQVVQMDVVTCGE